MPSLRALTQLINAPFRLSHFISAPVTWNVYVMTGAAAATLNYEVIQR